MSGFDRVAQEQGPWLVVQESAWERPARYVLNEKDAGELAEHLRERQYLVTVYAPGAWPVEDNNDE